MRARAGSIVVVATTLLLTGVAGSSQPVRPPPAGEVPRGMVAFVDGAACPPGWQVSALAAGRLLIGTDRADTVGHAVGDPLAAEEDRPHVHAVGVATIALPAKSIAAADGSNDQGAGAGDQPVVGTAAAATSGLPFVQLTACVSP